VSHVTAVSPPSKLRPDAPAGAATDAATVGAPPAVALDRITRVFGVSPALVRVDLRIERGETVLLRGANGAGKSTLLRVIATLQSPTYGSGTVLGLDLMADREEIRARTEFVGHRTRLYEDLTAGENLRFACRLHGLPADGAAAALDRVGLKGVAGERVRGFSQGMRQRVAVARAVLRDPDLLLLDEPYAGLDTAAREAVDDLIRATAGRGATTIVATHEPSRGELATRTLFMQDGRLLPEGVDA
jgi:heme ABC exporter ATP-binding subunit CcmA